MIDAAMTRPRFASETGPSAEVRARISALVEHTPWARAADRGIHGGGDRSYSSHAVPLIGFTLHIRALDSPRRSFEWRGRLSRSVESPPPSTDHDFGRCHADVAF